MFTRIRKTIAVGVACLFVTGVAAYAQTQQPAAKRDQAAKRAAVQRQAQNRAGQQAQVQGVSQNRIRARQGSLQAILAPPNPALVARLAQHLGLTDEQKTQIRQLYATFAQTARPIRERRMAALKEFTTAFKDPAVTKADLERLAEPILQADRAILDAEFDFWLAFRGILTPAQQTQIQSMLEKGIRGMMANPNADRPLPNGRTQPPAAPARQNPRGR